MVKAFALTIGDSAHALHAFVRASVAWPEAPPATVLLSAAILALRFAAIALCLPGCKYPPARLSRPSELAAEDSQLVFDRLAALDA